MVYRYTGIAAFATMAFAFTLLNGLLRPTVEGPPWQFVVLAGLALGAVITWTGLTYRMRGWVVSVINVIALAIVSFRIAAPETLVFLFPTGDTLSALNEQRVQAMNLIRTGIEPVIPVSGLVVVVTAVFWAVGALIAYALLRGRPVLAVVPGLVLALQFATMDRSPTELLHILIFIVLLAGSVLAVTWDERINTAGRMAHASGRQPTRSLLGQTTAVAVAVTLFGSLLAVGAFRSQVPYDGVLTWRASTGLTGDFYGGVRYNPFTSIQQSLVTNSDTPLFVARIEGDVDPDQVYFRLLTLETYDRGKFFADHPEVQPLETEVWEDEAHAFAGQTAEVITTVSVENLTMDWLPAPYVPLAVDTFGDEALYKSIRTRKDDGSLRLDGGSSFRGMQYGVRADVPVPNLDVLSAGDGGELSPLFIAAAEADESVPTPLVVPAREEPPNEDRYLQLPDDLDEGIATLARQKTLGLETPFEVGLALEAWFRSSDFRYTIDIEPGHGATDLAEWLLPEYSDTPFHRAGYCENFATSMAVMARTLGVPSRVVLGFTPGRQTSADNVVVVQDRNAHAWVELWMPTQGWVRFDPTPRPDGVNPTTTGDVEALLGFDVVEYFDDIPPPAVSPSDSALPDRLDPSAIPDENFGDLDLPEFADQVGGAGGGLPGWLGTVLLALAAVLVLTGAIPLAKWWRHRRRMARLRNGDITAAWEDIVARLEDFGEPPSSGITPDELAEGVDPAMEALATVYGRAVYGPPGGVDESHVTTATKSLEQTSARLTGRYSTAQRVLAWYRPASLLPEWWRKRRSR